MKAFGVLFLLIFPAISFGISLEDYVAEVTKTNPSILASKNSATAAKYKIDPASTWEDPYIALGRDEIPFSEGMGYVNRYQISQTIPFPGKSQARSEIASLQAKSLENDSETTERQIKILATQIYFKAYINEKAIELNSYINGILKTVSDSLRARYKSGEGGHHDWVLAQVENSILEVERLRLLREQKSLQAVFNELRNKPTSTPIDHLSFDIDKLVKTTELNSKFPEDQPELKSLELYINQVKEEESLAELSYFPDITLQGMMMEPSPDMMEQQKNWGFMVGISVPLYFWRKQNDLIKSATAQRKSAEFQRQSLLNRLSSEWTDAQEQFKSSKDVVELYKSSVMPSTKLAVQNAKTAYASRRLSLDQYLNTLKTQRTQELELLYAEMDFYLAKLRMEELLSNPPLMRLSPNRPTLFGGGDMGANGMNSMSSGAVNMGGAMKVPNKKKTESMDNSGGGMGGM